MALDPTDLPDAVRGFLLERHLATLTTLRPDGTPHVVPVGFTWDGVEVAVRVITSGTSVKARNARISEQAGGRAAVCQLDGRRWVTLEGRIGVLDDAPSVRDAEGRYETRYRRPRENPHRVVLRIAVDRVLGSVPDPGTA